MGGFQKSERGGTHTLKKKEKKGPNNRAIKTLTYAGLFPSSDGHNSNFRHTLQGLLCPSLCTVVDDYQNANSRCLFVGWLVA